MIFIKYVIINNIVYIINNYLRGVGMISLAYIMKLRTNFYNIFENFRNYADDTIESFNNCLEFIFSIIPFILVLTLLLYICIALINNFIMSKRINVKKQKILIQGVHGSGKTYNLLLKSEFGQNINILNNNNGARIIDRIVNVQNLEYEYRSSNIAEKINDSKISKDIAYISCTGLNVQEIYKRLTQSCLVNGPFGSISKLMVNIKSINVFQTTVDFDFTSNFFIYNNKIKSVIIDDIDRMKSNDFANDINELLGLLRETEKYFNIILIYATKWEFEYYYVHSKEIKGTSRLGSFNNNGFSFIHKKDYDLIFNELIQKSNFDNFVNVKLEKNTIEKILNENIIDDFKFYSNKLAEDISNIKNIDVDVRSLLKVIYKFNTEYEFVKNKNLIYSKMICYNLKSMITGYFDREISSLTKRNYYFDSTNLFDYTSRLLRTIRHNDVRDWVENKENINQSMGNKFEEIKLNDFSSEKLLLYIRDDSSDYHNLLNEVNNIINTNESNYKTVSELWNKFKEKNKKEKE